jgi:hypothetical protein
MEPAMSNDSSGNPDELSSGGSRYHQVYPTLDERQLAILERYGERRKLKTDDILYSEGDRRRGALSKSVQHALMARLTDTLTWWEKVPDTPKAR